MPKSVQTKTYILLAAGGTTNLDVSLNYDIYYLKPSGGAITLLADIIFSPTGTVELGTQFYFKYVGGVTIGAHQVTLFGVNLTAAQALSKLNIEVFYNGTTWEVTILPSSTTGVKNIDGNSLVDASVQTASINDGAVTLSKQAPLAARGYLTRGGVDGALAGFNAVTAGALVMGNGTDVVSQVPTGDVTINSAGVMTIGAGKVTPSMLNFTPVSYFEASLSLSSAQILALNTSQQNIIPNPGVGKYIDVVSATYQFTYSTAVYATNTRLQIITSAGDTAMLQDDGALISSLNKFGKFVSAAAPAAGVTCINTNRGVDVKVATGDPTGGSGTIKINILYRIVTA